MLNIRVFSRFHAETAARHLTEPTAVISITSKGEDPAKIKEDSVHLAGLLRMSFNDVDFGEADGTGALAPVQEDLAGLKVFVDEMAGRRIANYVVHCGAGISRSAAVAAAVGEYLGTDAGIWQDRFLHPNLLVYKLACRELGIGRTQEDLEKLFGVRKAVSVWNGNDPEKMPNEEQA